MTIKEIEFKIRKIDNGYILIYNDIGNAVDKRENFHSSFNGLLDKIKAKYVQPRAGDVKHSLADINGAREFLKYEPEVSVEEGLEIYTEWFKKQIEN